MTALALKLARMELKTTPDAKELLSQAAALDGLDLSSFVLGTAMERARRMLAEHSAIKLSQRGQETLARLLASDTAPTEAMRELMNLPAFPERRG